MCSIKRETASLGLSEVKKVYLPTTMKQSYCYYKPFSLVDQGRVGRASRFNTDVTQVGWVQLIFGH